MQLLANLLPLSGSHLPVLSHAGALFFAFLIGHALADYPLQGKFLAIRKNRHIKSVDYSGDTPGSVWVYCLTAHSLVHAGCTWFICEHFQFPNPALFAFIECVLHWLIDFAKCERWTNFHADQSLHLLCKIGYIVAFFQLAP